MSRCILIIFMGLLLAACSANKPRLNAQGQYVYASTEEAILAFETSSIKCKDLSDCPEYVGGVVTNVNFGEESLVSVCSMTLIAEDRVLTNRHCLPVSIRYRTANCKNLVRFNFPKTIHQPEERIDCDHVMDIVADSSNAQEGKRDWAILKLSKKTKRNLPNQNLKGIPPRQTVYMNSAYTELVDMDTYYSPNTEIRTTKCETSLLLNKTNYYYHPLSPLFAVDGCSQYIQHGNSGSGVFSQDNELIGVISGMIGLASEMERGTLKGIGTNLACVEYFNPHPSPFCHYENSEDYLREVALIKGMTILNQERYYDVVEKVQSQNPYLRQGKSQHVGKFNSTSDVFQKVFPFSVTEPEIIKFYVDQTIGFMFENIGSCVERKAPAEFEAQLPVQAVEMDTEHFSERAKVSQQLHSMHFKRVGSIYRVEYLNNEHKITLFMPICKDQI